MVKICITAIVLFVILTIFVFVRVEITPVVELVSSGGSDVEQAIRQGQSLPDIKRALDLPTYGEDVQADELWRSALEVAVSKNRADVIEWLIDSHDLPTHGPVYGYAQPLNVANVAGSSDAIRVLLKLGADPFYSYNNGGSSVYHARKRYQTVLSVYQDAGVDINSERTE
ncbi:MAG: hypothetical protein RIG82_04540 [Phycisphaeraceae bacterium]